jgi:hypothetical protein
MNKIESRKKAQMRRDESRNRTLGAQKEARRQLQKIVDDWDASGKTKTSAYWRLLSQLEGMK